VAARVNRPDHLVGTNRASSRRRRSAARVSFGMVRKRASCPAPWSATPTASVWHGLIEISADLIEPNSRVVVIDDLLATGGTAAATARLCEMYGTTVACAAFVIELGFLDGRKKLAPVPVDALLTFG
jgi:adenine phosphoribosyltransferase